MYYIVIGMAKENCTDIVNLDCIMLYENVIKYSNRKSDCNVPIYDQVYVDCTTKVCDQLEPSRHDHLYITHIF